MHARLGAIAARQRKLADEREVALKSRGQRGLNAAALVARHREFVDGLDATSLEKLHAAFLAHGRTRPGFIVAKELAPLLRSLGDAPRPAEIQELIAAVDADGNAAIDFEEFLVLVAMRSQHRHSPDEILAAFRLFDPDNTGFIPVRDFRDAMSRLVGLPDAEIDDIIGEALLVSRAEAAKRAEQREAKAARKAARRAARAAAAVSVASRTSVHVPTLGIAAAVGGSAAVTDAGGLPLTLPVLVTTSPLESPCMPGELVVATARRAAELALHGDAFAPGSGVSDVGSGDCLVEELFAAAGRATPQPITEPAPLPASNTAAEAGYTDIEEGGAATSGAAACAAGAAVTDARGAAAGLRPAESISADEAVIYYETFVRVLFSY